MRQSPWQKKVEKDRELLPSLCPPFSSSPDSFLLKIWSPERDRDRERAARIHFSLKSPGSKATQTKGERKEHFYLRSWSPEHTPLLQRPHPKVRAPAFIQDRDKKKWKKNIKGSSAVERKSTKFFCCLIPTILTMSLNTNIVFLKNCKSQIYEGFYDYSRRLLELFDEKEAGVFFGTAFCNLNKWVVGRLGAI